MWSLKNKIFYVAYCLFGKKLPYSRRSKVAKKIRYFLNSTFLIPPTI